jgi:hypothetical protein
VSALLLTGCVLAALAVVFAALWLHARSRAVADVQIVDPGGPRLEPSGAARSVQAAELTMPAAALEELWSLEALERLARTYWRFLSRVTLGLVRVVYGERERAIVLVARPLVLLCFDAPEYELDADHGVVRWRIRRGLLVSRRGRDGRGYLEIAIRRLPAPAPGLGRLHIEVEVESFYPAIAEAISRRLYTATQSRIHVLITHAFLRSLARLDLAVSRVGRFSGAAAP